MSAADLLYLGKGWGSSRFKFIKITLVPLPHNVIYSLKKSEKEIWLRDKVENSVEKEIIGNLFVSQNCWSCQKIEIWGKIFQLTHYFTRYFKCCLLYNQQMNKLKNLEIGSNFLQNKGEKSLFFEKVENHYKW